MGTFPGNEVWPCVTCSYVNLHIILFKDSIKQDLHRWPKASESLLFVPRLGFSLFVFQAPSFVPRSTHEHWEMIFLIPDDMHCRLDRPRLDGSPNVADNPNRGARERQAQKICRSTCGNKPSTCHHRQHVEYCPPPWQWRLGWSACIGSIGCKTRTLSTHWSPEEDCPTFWFATNIAWFEFASLLIWICILINSRHQHDGKPWQMPQLQKNDHEDSHNF